MGTVLVRVARLAFAGLGIAAIVAAIRVTGSLTDFFSYFTIESNLLAIVVLLVGGALDPPGRRWVYVRGAATAVHWYPYPFLNPTHAGGYGRVALYAVVLALFMGLLALAVNALARWRIRAPA